MAIFLKNSVFIHMPKTGGRWVKKALKNGSSIVKGDVPETAHYSPDLGNLGGFTFVRHPATWLRSLFFQRKSKKFQEIKNRTSQMIKI